MGTCKHCSVALLPEPFSPMRKLRCGLQQQHAPCAQRIESASHHHCCNDMPPPSMQLFTSMGNVGRMLRCRLNMVLHILCRMLEKCCMQNARALDGTNCGIFSPKFDGEIAMTHEHLCCN